MPISKENKKLYPSNWKEIREHIRNRAGNKCEKCGVENNILIIRDIYSNIYQDFDGVIYDADTSKKIGENYIGELPHPSKDFITVVCTVAHLDHNPSNCLDENLRFWCQRCHNRYDRKHRNETMRNKKNRNQLKLDI
jgi:hypothetical protein